MGIPIKIEEEREPTEQARQALADFNYIHVALGVGGGMSWVDATEVATDIVLALIDAGAYWNPILLE